MAAVQTQLLLSFLALAFAGASQFQRPPPRKALHFPSPHDVLSPEQVHISLVGSDKMRISWVTKGDAPSIVYHSTSPSSKETSAMGSSIKYKYVLYKSGLIHHVVIGPLKPDTMYYYRCGLDSAQEFSFKTPPAQLPLEFAVVGDLGQTGWTNDTLNRIASSDYDVMLLPGDLAYADTFQDLWDSFGRLVEPLASRKPWMVTHGNHEVERIPILHGDPFTSYNARWRMPYEEGRSGSNLYYSFDVADAVHIVMLGSYTEFGPGSAQYKWLEGDLGRVDRKRTPWVFALVHAPWYNSNEAHQGERESVQMKEAMEGLLYRGRVDIVFAGHVHAYERFVRVYDERADNCGPIYITVGNGGNRERLAKRFIYPQPDISAYREADFGHGRLNVVNATHAQWTLHRNDDESASDSVWLTSLASEPACMDQTVPPTTLT